MTLELTTDEQKEFEKLLGSGITLPAQPSVMLEIEHLIHSPKVRLDAIAKLISSDTALTHVCHAKKNIYPYQYVTHQKKSEWHYTCVIFA